MAAVICKNLIANRGNTLDVWLQLEPFFKNNMKEAILSSLASQSSSVRTQIASLVSAIAAIEIPRGEWLDLISNLCNNAGHSEHHIKLASLQTLGFICEELEPQDLSSELKNAIIVALTTSINIQEGEKGHGFPATKLAVKALLHSVPYAAQNFKVEHERSFIMQCLFSALTIPDIEIRENAMQTLVEIVRQEYESVEFYFQKIAEVTAKAATSDEQKVGA